MCYCAPWKWIDFGDIWPWELKLMAACRICASLENAIYFSDVFAWRCTLFRRRLALVAFCIISPLSFILVLFMHIVVTKLIYTLWPWILMTAAWLVNGIDLCFVAVVSTDVFVVCALCWWNCCRYLFCHYSCLCNDIHLLLRYLVIVLLRILVFLFCIENTGKGYYWRDNDLSRCSMFEYN